MRAHEFHRHNLSKSLSFPISILISIKMYVLINIYKPSDSAVAIAIAMYRRMLENHHKRTHFLMGSQFHHSVAFKHTERDIFRLFEKLMLCQVWSKIR